MLTLWIQTTDKAFPGSRSFFLTGTNDGVVYNIAGSTIQEQSANISLMGQYMQGPNGRGNLAEHIQDLIEDIDKENFPRPSAFVDYMFGSADEFYLEAAVVVEDLAEGATLLDVLGDIAEVLIAV
ncbi:hypothetical protein [Ferruginibacter sp.]|nr:hypothetical protein [Ferruginibacter sp.]